MKKQAELHWIGRAEFKNGFILHRISSGENTYNVTIARGRVTSCCEMNGESCKGFKYGKGQCRHAEYAMAREQELAAVKEAERVVSPIAAKVQEAASIRDALRPSEKGTLSSNRGFSLMAV